MSSRFRRPQPATIIASLALFVALGSPGVAASLIKSQQIQNNTIRSADIRDRAVQRRDLAANALNTPRETLRKLNRAPGRISSRLLPGGEGSGVNADRLDGLNSVDLVRRCTIGSVLAWVQVDASATFGAVYTRDPAKLPKQYNCAGPVEVRRAEAGAYLVRLPGIDLNGTVAVASAAGGGEGANNFVAVNRQQDVGGEVVWRVTIKDDLGGAGGTGALEDSDFVLVVL